MNRLIDNQPSRNNNDFYYGYIIVIAAFFIMLMIYGIQYTFGIFFKPMLSDFGWSRALTSGAFSLSWLVTGIMSIVVGGLNDKYGPRVVITINGLIAGVGFILISQINAAWHLYLFYGVMVGTGISVYVPLLSMVAKWFAHRRTTMSGIVVTGIGIGMVIAPIVSNWLITNFSWRTSGIILGITVLVVVISAAQFLKRDPGEIGQPLYGENKIRAAMIEQEAKAFSFKEAINTRQFWLSFIMFFGFGYCLLTILVHLTPYSTDQGIMPATAANILATIGGASIVGRLVLGSLGDKIGNKNGFILSFTLMLVSTLLLISANETWSLFLFAAVFGLGYGNLVANHSPLVATLFGLSSHGLILGFVNFGFNLGATIGPFIAGYLFDITGSYQPAFIINVAICTIGLVSTILLTPTKRK
jgi:MFS family permease